MYGLMVREGKLNHVNGVKRMTTYKTLSGKEIPRCSGACSVLQAVFEASLRFGFPRVNGNNGGQTTACPLTADRLLKGFF